MYNSDQKLLANNSEFIFDFPSCQFLNFILIDRNEPPSKGVLAVNTSLVKVKRPVSYRLIWSFSPENTASSSHELRIRLPNENNSSANESCSIWFPVAPKGYVAVGCVVSPGSEQPSLSSALCILSSLVSPCAMKDCIAFQMADVYAIFLFIWQPSFSFCATIVVFMPFFFYFFSDMLLTGHSGEWITLLGPSCLQSLLT